MGKKKTALDATNIQSGDRVEQSLTDAVSASHDTRETEDFQA